jgi:putative metallohydrolase (TIGR04338 family)
MPCKEWKARQHMDDLTSTPYRLYKAMKAAGFFYAAHLHRWTNDPACQAFVVRHNGQRDFQKSKVYASEQALRGTLHEGETLPIDTEAVQAYIDAVLESAVWQGMSKITTITIEHKAANGRTWAHAHTLERKIRLPRRDWAHTELTILHELAHFVPPSDTPDHGVEFCWAFLSLVGSVIGEEARRALEQQYDKHGVRFE